MSVRRELLKIREEAGELTRRTVVEFARPKSHPLHDHFDWNNTSAGEKYRLIQAGRLIKSVKLDFVRPNGERGHVKQWHVVPRNDDQLPVYEPLEEIVEDELATRLLLNRMRRDWATFKSRYQHLAEFVELLRGETEVA